jgi:hypothetical protein
LQTAELQNQADFQKAREVYTANGFGGSLRNAPFTLIFGNTILHVDLRSLFLHKRRVRQWSEPGRFVPFEPNHQ